MSSRGDVVSKQARFEVFKRDNFTCRYCGAKAPDVLLEIDHVVPRAEGGTNDLVNLTTSCAACNGGKGKRRLEDASILERQRDEFEQLMERREQLQMLLAKRAESGYASTQREYQRKHRALGLCVLCPRPAVNASFCAEHRDAARVRAKAAFRVKNPRAKMRRCGRCGERGHNRATCK
jgi:hypothetical protein